MKKKDAGFTLLEVLIAIIVLTVGAIAVIGAFSEGLFASRTSENMESALHIAQAKLEEIKDTAFDSLADSGPTADPDFPEFDVTVDVSEGDNPMEVDVTVSWNTKGGEASATLTTLVADY
ncbi:MAG: prepilin-type N-terminal cleavage/methylation domain-containing protein [Candidatus Omnitrophica bacterium]|nr:prepilin-type N-terminal cleavage/methylation domain-containing protein [Candidatus Omnitrophota bacterium]